MKISKDTQTKARRLLKLCMVNGFLDHARVRTIARTLAERKPRNYLPLLSAFANLVRLELAKKTVTVQSAVPLTDAEKSDIASGLEQKYGPGLDYDWSILPELIGGIHLQIGDNVLDGTLKTRIDKLRQSVESLHF
ncbi:F0F1 ATP synthase subunit delta [Akkermansia sp. N21116]|jgi:F-type H+-transporting ATPase subunit delta|uniref:F0F1 ATP synthase subunit delta n=1 Tax=Akkermansia sp. N21116 TaxID=3040764 RepID=UPI00244E6222|nr:F0F1 ATP synthase subunit delta [Akkermansia sp. N21116]WPX40762.1 F0F1 ATP synthase subunit delta [Akkermansia sp. N21116]